MKRRVLTFLVLFIALVVVLSIIRIIFIGDFTGITGKVVNEEFNSVFSWRDFNLEINSVEIKADSVKLNYLIKNFANEIQKIKVNFYINQQGKAKVYAGNEEVTIPIGASAENKKEFLLSNPGEYVVYLEATNGRKTITSSGKFEFSKTTLTGEAIQEVKSNGWHNIILAVLIVIMVIIIIIELRKKKDIFSVFKNKHHRGFISLDLK